MKVKRRKPIVQQLAASVGGHWVYDGFGHWTCGDGKRTVQKFGGGNPDDGWEAIRYPTEFFLYEDHKPSIRWYPEELRW